MTTSASFNACGLSKHSSDLTYDFLHFRPSTVILVIVGGMLYSGVGNLDEITIVVLICLVVVGYVLVCLFTSQNFQLKVSKLLTFVFAVIMCIVVIGVAVQISSELKARNAEPTAVPTAHTNTTATAAPKPLEHHLPAGVSTLYLAGLSGIFIAAALLHPKEFTCLLHGIWYLLSLPSGYLLLTIYSLCNLTDRSWGKFSNLPCTYIILRLINKELQFVIRVLLSNFKPVQFIYSSLLLVDDQYWWRHQKQYCCAM